MFMANHGTVNIIGLCNSCSWFIVVKRALRRRVQYANTHLHTQTHQPADNINDPWSTQAGIMHVNSTGTLPAGTKAGLSRFRPSLTTGENEVQAPSL